MEATHFSMANSTTTQKLCNWFIQQANAKGLGTLKGALAEAGV